MVKSVRSLSKSSVSRVALVVAAMAMLAGCSNVQDAGKSYEGFEQRLIGNTLVGIGLAAPERERIDYRPRAPLVIPPGGQALRPPEDVNDLRASNAAWPADPDEMRRRRAKAEANEPVPNMLQTTDAGRRLSPDELAAGAGPALGSGQTASAYPDRGGRVLNPDELEKGWQPPSGTSIFNDPEPNDTRGRRAFGETSNPQFDQQRDTYSRERDSVDTSKLGGAEPARKTLIDPPTGYRAPAPDPTAGQAPADEGSPWYKRMFGQK